MARRMGTNRSSGPQASAGYFDWHAEPGYVRDITRHFAPSMRLLDVGCGTGWLAAHFHDYVGVDGSADAVAVAREHGRDARVHDLAAPLPFEDASFDAAVAKDVLEHLLEPHGLVAEIARVLRPGGRVYACSPDAQRWVWDDYTHVRPFTLTGFRRLFADQGLEVARSGYESVMPGIGILAGMSPRRRRPPLLNALARTRLVRRNVWVLATRPA